MNVIVGGRAGRSPYQRPIQALLILGLLLALVAGAAIVGSQLLQQRPQAPSISRVPFTEPLFQVIFADDGTTWASTAQGDATTFRVTGIHRVNADGVTSTPVITDLPTGHVSFVVLDGVIWASNDEAGTWLSWDAKTGARLGGGDLGSRPLEPISAYGSVWQNLYGSNEVVRVDPDTGSTVRIETAPGPRGLAAGAGHVWVVHPYAPVMGIDPTTNTVTTRFDPGSTSCGISVAGGRVWVFSCSSSVAAEVFEPDGTLAKTYVGDGAPWFAFDYDGDVWTIETKGESRDFVNGSIVTTPSMTRAVRLDPVTFEPLASYDIGEQVGVAGRSDTVTGTLDSDALWLVQGQDVIRVPLALLPERPTE
jgi:hypothetical protein